MINLILLQAQGGNPIMQFLPIILIVVVFYFFMIRPQTKKAKEHKEFVEKLAKGDKIITTGGIHGRIVEVTDTNMLVEVDNGVKIRFEKNAISTELSKVLNTSASN